MLSASETFSPAIANSYAFHTLGCKLNFAESSSLAGQLTQAGYVQKKFEDYDAGIYILNTCSVTDNADKECRQIIRKIKKRQPSAFVVIIGCYAQLKPTEIACIEGVDLVLGANEKFNLVSHIKSLRTHHTQKIHSCDISTVQDFVSAFSLHDRTRAFLKIQDGCDYKCTYCTIPLARGKSRSKAIESIVQDVWYLHEQGVKEIVLTGVNLGDYTHEQYRLIDAIESLSKCTFMPRLRISSIEPNLLTKEIIETVARSSNFMPHFHLPLQSGSNAILALMRRRYNKELYKERVEWIKSIMPDASIGVDVISGFPGEGQNEFQQTVDFLSDLNVSYLHAFTYSERADTPATHLPAVVPISLRKERTLMLRKLSMQKSYAFKQKYLYSKRPVLFESANHKTNFIEGYTDNYISVQTLYQEHLENSIVDWVIQ